MRTAYIDKLIGSLNSAGCDAVLLCPSEELRFFAGFSPLMCERFQGLFLKKDGTMFYFCNLLTGDEAVSYTHLAQRLARAQAEADAVHRVDELFVFAQQAPARREGHF